MRVKTLLAALFAVFMTASYTASAAPSRAGDYRKAVKLYRNGMYERARSIFETISDDPLSEAYVVLCAVKMQSDDYLELMEEYHESFPSSTMTSRIRLENARLLFDQGRYADAAMEFAEVDSAALPDSDLQEYMFKCGYCQFALGNYPEAHQFFTILEALEFSEYTAPGRYLSAVMHYNNSEFAEAEAGFWKASSDPRFTDVANFYIVDCEFNQKNYQFAVTEGEKIYADSPAGRKERLARIISEAYLIMGDTEKARQYYDGLSLKDMNRKDYFYAGSVMYSVHDYQGAIDNFLKMEDRSDSLGQIANYHLANSYMRTRNQVAAMNAFHDASNVEFDPEITEDASFNYAKLAFDLNKDTGGFARYIKRYSTKTRGVQIYGYMALAALVDRDYAGAVEAYDNIDDLSDDMQNNYTKANFLRGEQLFAGGSYRDAAPFFRATAYYLPKTDRLNQLSRYWMAESYYRTGNFAEAEKLFTELYNASALYGMKEGSILAYNVGYSLFKQKKYEAAARWFDTYIASGDLQFRQDAMNRRADCDFGRHDYAAASISYQKVVTEFYSPDNIYPYYQQAISYGLSGDKKRKVSTLLHLEDASPEAPLYSEAWYELGRAQMDVRNNNDAIRSFTHLKNTTKDKTYQARALIGLGMVYRNMSEYEKALENYKAVVTMMPGSEYSEESMLAIESIYQRMRRPEKFLEYLEENRLNLSKSEEEKAKMYFNTAEQLYLAENYSQAIPSIQKYLGAYPQGADVMQANFYLAESYRALGEKEKAIASYALILDHQSEYAFAEMSKLRYAELSYELQRYQDAYKGYEALLTSTKMDVNKSVARAGMMRSAYRSKDYEASITASGMVMNDNSQTPELRREAKYVKAKSSLATSRRDEAMKLFAELGANPSTPEGAEGKFMTIQDLFDTGSFDKVENEVYAFSQDAGEQSYWLAKAYLVLGDSFAERSMYDQAKATYESIRDGYVPYGSADDVPDNVKMRLERLANLMNK